MSLIHINAIFFPSGDTIEENENGFYLQHPTSDSDVWIPQTILSEYCIISIIVDSNMRTYSTDIYIGSPTTHVV